MVRSQSGSIVDDQEKRIDAEIKQLLVDIRRIGPTHPPGTPHVLFGELFDDDDVQQYYEALVGTLKCAKKRGKIRFKGQMLLRGVHDNVTISIVEEGDSKTGGGKAAEKKQEKKSPEKSFSPSSSNPPPKKTYRWKKRVSEPVAATPQPVPSKPTSYKFKTRNFNSTPNLRVEVNQKPKETPTSPIVEKPKSEIDGACSDSETNTSPSAKKTEEKIPIVSSDSESDASVIKSPRRKSTATFQFDTASRPPPSWRVRKSHAPAPTWSIRNSAYGQSWKRPAPQNGTPVPAPEQPPIQERLALPSNKSAIAPKPRPSAMPAAAPEKPITMQKRPVLRSKSVSTFKARVSAAPVVKASEKPAVAQKRPSPTNKNDFSPPSIPPSKTLSRATTLPSVTSPEKPSLPKRAQSVRTVSAAAEASSRVGDEVQQLVKDICRVGSNPGEPSVTFGELFDDEVVQQTYEALVGTLRSAKRKGLIRFKGQMLLKGMHDNVVISVVEKV